MNYGSWTKGQRINEISRHKFKKTQNYACVFVGRGGKKRKAEVQVEEEKPSVEEKKGRGEDESSQEGLRVVIEHW